MDPVRWRRRGFRTTGLRTVMKLQDIHARSLATSSALSGYYVKNAILPLDVIAVLNAAKVKFVLVGAHAAGGWMRKPRATEDVDVVVAARYVKKAVRALLKTFPHLEVDDQPVVARLRDQETKAVAIDVLKPYQQPYTEALKHTHTVSSGGQTYQIPSLEMALTMKLAAMISPGRRDADKFQDAHDFMYMVEANPDIDLEKLADLGELVYTGVGEEIVEKVRQVRAGERLVL
jgi:hypothetical protein